MINILRHFERTDFPENLTVCRESAGSDMSSIHFSLFDKYGILFFKIIISYQFNRKLIILNKYVTLNIYISIVHGHFGHDVNVDFQPATDYTQTLN